MRLARLDERGLSYIDGSLDGFWKSFFAAVLAAPLYLALVLTDMGRWQVEVGLFRLFVVSAIVYVIAWTAFPLAMYYLTKAIDREARYCLHIASYNWAQLLQYLLGFLVLVVLASSGAISEKGQDALQWALNLAFAVYEWFIAKSALRIPGMGAAGIFVLSFLFAILMNDLRLALLGLTPQDLAP